MREELTTAMHSEFTITEATELKHKAFAALEMMALGYTQAEAFRLMKLTADQVSPHLAEFIQLTAKQVRLE